MRLVSLAAMAALLPAACGSSSKKAAASAPAAPPAPPPPAARPAPSAPPPRAPGPPRPPAHRPAAGRGGRATRTAAAGAPTPPSGVHERVPCGGGAAPRDHTGVLPPRGHTTFAYESGGIT